MNWILTVIMRWWAREKGATTTEYAILLAVVVIALIATLQKLTTALDTKITEIISGIREAGGG